MKDILELYHICKFSVKLKLFRNKCFKLWVFGFYVYIHSMSVSDTLFTEFPSEFYDDGS